MEDFVIKLKHIIQAVFGILLALIGIRFLLELFQADRAHSLVAVFYDLSGGLVDPFFTTFQPVELGVVRISLDIVLAFGVVVFIGFFVSEIIASFVNRYATDIVVDLVDAFLKLFEFILACRFIFVLYGVSAMTSPFAVDLLGNTNWIRGILPSYAVGNGEIELSTALVLLIVVIIDLALEGTVDRYRSYLVPSRTKPQPSVPTLKSPPPPPPNPSQPHITINVAAPPPPNVAMRKEVLEEVAQPRLPGPRTG